MTRLPILNNLYRNKLYHHDNRHLLKFSDSLESDSKNNKIDVNSVDVDQYFATFEVKLDKPLTSKKAMVNINKDMKNYFGEIPPGALIRLEQTPRKVCIPSELFPDTWG